MKKLWKDLIKRTVNDLPYEITIVRKETIELKNEFKNIKSDNNDLRQELLLLNIDKNLDQNQSYNEQDEHKDGDESYQ